MMRALVAIVALLAAAPAAAQTSPATAAQIAEGIAACRAVTTVEKVDYRPLDGMSWPNITKRNGRSQSKIAGIRQKEGNPVLMVVTDDEVRAKICVVRARLAQSGDYSSTLQALSDIIGMPSKAEGFAYFWTLDGHEVKVEPAGSRDEPIAHFVISGLPAEAEADSE